MISRIFRGIRHNLVAWLALFVAMGGTSMAATHYLITSTKQIKPSVLNKLHGPSGARGPAGANGVNGSIGPAGPKGERGEAGKEGAKGEPGTKGNEGKTGARGEGEWKGGYSAGETYSKGQIVSYEGSSYISLAGANKANTPETSVQWWELVAEKGKPGGATGPKGEGEWKGGYSAGETYSKGQIVSEGGSSYISLMNLNKGNKPSTSASDWALMAEKGAKGEKGEAGKEGAQGETGTPGGAVAYAHIFGAKGEIGEGNHGFEHATVTLGVNAKTKAKEEGIYCIAGLEVEPVTAVATLDAEELAEEPEEAAGGPAIDTFVGDNKEYCKTGTQVVVETYANAENAKKEVNFETVDQGFYIQID